MPQEGAWRLKMPVQLRGPVKVAAARAGVSMQDWLAAVILRELSGVKKEETK